MTNFIGRLEQENTEITELKNFVKLTGTLININAR